MIKKRLEKQITRAIEIMKKRHGEYFDECYNEACKAAAVETQLPLTTFPESSPFTKSDVLDVNVDDYFIE